LEIRTEVKTLPSSCFNGPEGVLSGERFTPVAGVDYQVVAAHEFEGVRLKQGQRLRLSFKNKRHFHYKVL